MLSSPLQRFSASVGVRSFAENGGASHGQSRDMGNGVQIRSADPVTDPKPFLPGTFETGIVPLTLRSQRIGSLELQTASVNRESVVRRDRFIFGAARFFFPLFHFCGYRDISRFWICGKDSSIFVEFVRYLRFSHLCS